jgi:hypothetical protein
LRVDLVVLAAIPNFSLPPARCDERLPHPAIEARPVPPRGKRRGVSPTTSAKAKPVIREKAGLTVMMAASSSVTMTPFGLASMSSAANGHFASASSFCSGKEFLSRSDHGAQLHANTCFLHPPPPIFCVFETFCMAFKEISLLENLFSNQSSQDRIFTICAIHSFYL